MRLYWPFVFELLHELEEAGAVPVFRRIALERAEVALGIGLDQVVVADGGVVVDVDDAGVGDHVLDRGARADVVAVEDGVDRVPVDQALHRLHVGGVAHLLGVFEVGLERPAEDAAQRVDLLAGQRQAVLELDAVGGGEVGQRRRLADRDRLAVGAGAVIDAGQQGAAGAQRRGAFDEDRGGWE